MRISSFGLIRLCVFTVYVIIPSAIYLNPNLILRGIFINYHITAYFKNYNDFDSIGKSAFAMRNFYLNSKDNITTLGVWHILANEDVFPNDTMIIPTENDFDIKLKNGRPIIIYVHDNDVFRGGSEMIDIYNVFTALQYHLITFDYRGFGDSKGFPTCEEDVIDDAMAVYEYVKSKAPSSPIFLWGNSMGAAISTGLCARLRTTSSKLTPPLGIVLEAPFTTLLDAFSTYTFSKIYSWTPYFQKIFIDNLNKTDTQFSIFNNMEHCIQPYAIFHSKDDPVVPYNMSLAIFEEAKRLKRNLRFHTFAEEGKYGHHQLYLSPHFVAYLKKFVDDFTAKK